MGERDGEGGALYATGDDASRSAWALAVASVSREVHRAGDAPRPPHGVGFGSPTGHHNFRPLPQPLVQQDDKSAQPTRARTYREHRYAGSA